MERIEEVSLYKEVQVTDLKRILEAPMCQIKRKVEEEEGFEVFSVCEGNTVVSIDKKVSSQVQQQVMNHVQWLEKGEEFELFSQLEKSDGWRVEEEERLLSKTQGPLCFNERGFEVRVEKVSRVVQQHLFQGQKEEEEVVNVQQFRNHFVGTGLIKVILRKLCDEFLCLDLIEERLSTRQNFFDWFLCNQPVYHSTFHVVQIVSDCSSLPNPHSLDTQQQQQKENEQEKEEKEEQHQHHEQEKEEKEEQQHQQQQQQQQQRDNGERVWILQSKIKFLIEKKRVLFFEIESSEKDVEFHRVLMNFNSSPTTSSPTQK